MIDYRLQVEKLQEIDRVIRTDYPDTDYFNLTIQGDAWNDIFAIPALDDVSDIINRSRNLYHPSTIEQTRFLIEHKFKVEPNLTKVEATNKIREYLDKLNKERPIKEYDY